MHVICSRETLAKGLQAVQKAVATKGLLPVLSNILLRAEGEHLILTATDLEIGIETGVHARILEPGSVTIPARTVSEIIGKLPNADVELVSDANGAETRLTCQKSRFQLRSLPADEFPALPKLEGEKQVSISGADLAKAIKQTIFAASNDATKTVLSGLRLHFDNDGMEMAATDGYRLAVRRLTLTGEIPTMNLIIPARAMAELARLLGGEEEQMVRLALIGQQAVFRFGEKYLTTRLLEGQYPDYRRILPKGLEKSMQADRQAFLDAVERVSIMASDRTQVIKLSLEAAEMTVWVETQDLGGATEQVEVQFEDDSTEIAFNAKYLTDALRSFECETLQMDLSGPINPILLHESGDLEYLCMLMPIRP